jgi:hypothetical protein
MMQGLIIDKVFEADENKSFQDIFIVILHADKIPPHVGLCLNDHFFSFKISGPEIFSRQLLFRSIRSKKIPSLFIKLHLPKPKTEVLSLAENIFKSYPSVNENITCLEPIKEWSGKLFSINTSHIQSLHELIPALKRDNHVLETYAYHLPVSADHTYMIRAYGLNEILNRINQLSL